VQEVGSRLDNYCKTIVKVSSQGAWYKIRQSLQAMPAKVPNLTNAITSATSSLATEQIKRKGKTTAQLNNAQCT